MIVSAEMLRERIAAEGGFTVDLATGVAPRHGISVCVRPSLSLAFAWRAWDDRRVGEWLQRCAAEPARRSRHIGGWLDTRTDTVWLDVVRVVPSRLRDAAFAIGRAMDQHCVFDLGLGETVHLGERAA